jgi:hypothetical protein
MCRNIRVLSHFEPPASEEEIQAAALQYVRKVTGTTRPSRQNQAAFDRAVEEIAAITRRLVGAEYISLGPPRTREAEAVKAKVRGQKRDAQVRKRLGVPAG